MTRERPKCQVCGNGIHVAMFGRQWVHWSHLLDLDHKAVPPEPSQREAQDGSSGAGGIEAASKEALANGDRVRHASPGDARQPAPEPLPLTARQFDTIEAGYEDIWWRYA